MCAIGWIVIFNWVLLCTNNLINFCIFLCYSKYVSYYIILYILVAANYISLYSILYFKTKSKWKVNSLDIIKKITLLNLDLLNHAFIVMINWELWYKSGSIYFITMLVWGLQYASISSQIKTLSWHTATM